MPSVIIWTITNLICGWFVLGGVSQIYEPPSIVPAIASIVWVVALEATIILSYRSTKKDDFQ